MPRRLSPLSFSLSHENVGELMECSSAQLLFDVAVRWIYSYTLTCAWIPYSKIGMHGDDDDDNDNDGQSLARVKKCFARASILRIVDGRLRLFHCAIALLSAAAVAVIFAVVGQRSRFPSVLFFFLWSIYLSRSSTLAVSFIARNGYCLVACNRRAIVAANHYFSFNSTSS